MLLVTDNRYHCAQSIVVLGMFDGVHIGHQVLIQKGRVLANRHHVPLVVCTFSNHPLDVIAPEKSPKLLTDLQERADIMEKLGVDVLIASVFSAETMKTDPADYVGHLVQRFHPLHVICGYNHSFGKNGEGKPTLLQAIGTGLDFCTWVVPQITLDGMDVSSTEIRKQLSLGNISLTNKLLGRPYSLIGKVTEHAFIPRELRKQLPAAGCYRCLQKTRKGSFPCVVTIHSEEIILHPFKENTDMELSFLG